MAENSRVAIDNRKRTVPVETTPKTSPVYQNKRDLEEETYSNPLKKKIRVSLYNKTSPNPQRPRSVSPLESKPPTSLDLANPLLNSSSVVVLKDSDMDRLGLSPSGTSRKHSPKRPLSANSRAIMSNSNDPKRISPLTTSLLPPSDSFSSSSPFNTVKTDDDLPKSSPTDLPASTSNEKVRRDMSDEKKVSKNSSYNKTGIASDLKNSLVAGKF